MGKIQDIVQNPELEEHLVYYVGMRHMHQHWDEHLDPWLPIDFESVESYYHLMRDGLLSDLQRELQKNVGITNEDPDFEETLEDAIKVVVARHGMEQIVEAAREFLRIMQNVDLDEENIGAVFEVISKPCGTCKRPTVPMQAEDLPAGLRGTDDFRFAKGYGYCLKCKEILCW